MLDTLDTDIQAEVDEALGFRELNRYTDRCDKRFCGAQAFVLAVHIGSGHELTFCGHHGKEIMLDLENQGFLVDDQTHRINEKPSPSASEIDD